MTSSGATDAGSSRTSPRSGVSATEPSCMSATATIETGGNV